jgi:hypothetical protein
MEIQLREISLADRLQYLESITANQESNKVTNPWTMVIACTIGGVIISLIINSILTQRKEDKTQQYL